MPRPWAVVTSLSNRIHAAGDVELVRKHLTRLQPGVMLPGDKGWEESISWVGPGWCGFILPHIKEDA